MINSVENVLTGSPAVAADVPHAREQVNTAAILVYPADELEIAQTLRSLFHDQAKRENLIQLQQEAARSFAGDGFVKVLFFWLEEYQANRCWLASNPFPSA